MGCAMDQEIIWDTLANVLEAAKVLGIEDGFVREVRAKLSRLALPKIGSDGRLMEWAEELEEPEPGHRHMSHLYGLYPAWQFTPTTPKYFAARVPIEEQFTENVPFDVVAQLREDLRDAAVDGKDNVIINGDTDTSSPMDSDLTNPLDIRTVDDGLRKLCLSDAKVDAGANLASSHIFQALNSMGKYGNPSDVVIITSMKGWWELATLSELLAQVQYTEKPLVPNQIGALKIGVPVMISDAQTISGAVPSTFLSFSLMTFAQP